MAGKATRVAKGVRAIHRRVADFYGRRRAVRSIASTKRGRIGQEKRIGPFDAFGPHGHVFVRRKNRVDVFWAGFSYGRTAMASERPEIQRVCGRRDVPTNPAEHL